MASSDCCGIVLVLAACLVAAPCQVAPCYCNALCWRHAPDVVRRSGPVADGRAAVAEGGTPLLPANKQRLLLTTGNLFAFGTSSSAVEARGEGVRAAGFCPL